MIGARPRGFLGMGAGVLPGDQPGLGFPLPQAPPDPFIFGRGGARMSPEQVARLRDIAEAEMAEAGSFAPVGHWTQGLARALGGVTGGLRMRRADKADAEMAAESDAVTQALLDPNVDKATVFRAMANPRLSEGAQSVAELLAKGMMPAKPSAPPEIIELAAIANDPTQPPAIRKVAADRITALNDPMAIIPLPGNRGTFVGRNSQFATTMGGGGQTSGAQAPPTVLPPDFDFGDDNGGPAATSGNFPMTADLSAFKRAIIGQESGGRYGVANAEGSGAMGIGQVMPDTARVLAGRLGLPYRPDLMSGTGPEARRYQDAITDAAAKEAWEAGGGDLATAAMYYHGGSDQQKWGPKTRRYAQEVLGRMGVR